MYLLPQPTVEGLKETEEKMTQVVSTKAKSRSNGFLVAFVDTASLDDLDEFIEQIDREDIINIETVPQSNGQQWFRVWYWESK